MEFDDPRKPRFASWRSYAEFAHRVQHSRRFVWDFAIQAFLDTVLATVADRDVKISKDTILFRAQRGTELAPHLDEDGEEIGMDVVGFGAERMKPLASRAREGRANPAGIAVLYLASQEQTAISEIRPWVGSNVSIAQFKVLRDVRAINLSLGHGQTSVAEMMFSELSGDRTPAAEKIEKAIWIDIDNAFSRPITLSDDSGVIMFQPRFLQSYSEVPATKRLSIVASSVRKGTTWLSLIWVMQNRSTVRPVR